MNNELPIPEKKYTSVKNTLQNCYKINENVKKYTFQGKSML